MGRTNVRTRETSEQKKIRLATCLTSGHLFRNNSGVLRNPQGTPVRFGLGNESPKLNDKFKSSDLIGITPLIVQQAHVGQTWGIFTAVEVKKEGWIYKSTPHETAQLNFLKTVRSAGGMGDFCTSPADYLTMISRFYHETSGKT